MKKIIISILMLIITGINITGYCTEDMKRLGVYDFAGNKVISFPDLSIEYYSPQIIVVKDRSNNYYRTNEQGKIIGLRTYKYFGYEMIYLSDGNFIQLIDAQTPDDQNAKLVIYNSQGEVVFPYDNILKYEPLHFKHLKDGRIIAALKSGEHYVFEANKRPLMLKNSEELIKWLEDNKIITPEYKNLLDTKSEKEKYDDLSEKLEKWVNNPENAYMASDEELVTFQTRDGIGIRDKRYPTRVLVKPSNEYQNIIILGKYYAYYFFGKWGIRSIDGNVNIPAKFKTVPVIRGNYIFCEE